MSINELPDVQKSTIKNNASCGFHGSAKVQVVLWYMQTGSATEIQRMFRNEYQVVHPTRKTILPWNLLLTESGILNLREAMGDLRARIQM